ncbi:Bug family tripartite tricarboxylate transporter substrate binding protein [Pseudorhodoplanes sinuspersici]|nr:tripartite tricarboxylate transporter substrate binding protein [Pseudorhodoplanes sinuspersici]RKE72360.1 tripartite-type tricarboxylate transporter receptor subunit TctC [Pseudorhodoplanes sinuspersici]
MMLFKRAALLACLAMFGAIGAAPAQDFPNKPITIVLPYPPGASTEQVARLVQPILQERLKQPVIVENRPGGNGSIGTMAVARSDPDGHTIVLATNALMTITPHIQQMPFDPVKDFAPITTAVRGILGLAVHPSVPAKSVPEFIAYVKKNPKTVNYGTAGIGSPQHMAGLLLNRATGIELVHVPYKGGGPAMNDLLGGHIQSVVATIVTMLEHEKNGALRILGIGEKQRFSGIPHVQTISETVPGFEATSWLAFYAPAKTPKTVIDTLNRELVFALNNPEVKRKLEEAGLPVVADKPEELGRTTKNDLARWGELTRVMNVRAE